MKYSSLAVLAFIGDEVAVKTVHALLSDKSELQTPDYYDRSFEANELKQMNKPPVNPFDGLVHAQNGKLYDPETMREVDIEDSSAVQTHDWYDEDFDRNSNWLGEPIATVQKRIAMAQQRDWFDDSVTHADMQSQYTLNKFDGLYHRPDGKVYDVAGKEVMDQISEVQTGKSDWCDSGIKGTNWCA